MATLTIERIQQDIRAMSVARALTVANEVALAEGTLPAESLITVSEERSDSGDLWCIHYGARDCIRQRGGDLIVMVDQQSDAVREVLHGQ
jgi:hypothetical protein